MNIVKAQGICKIIFSNTVLDKVKEGDILASGFETPTLELSGLYIGFSSVLSIGALGIGLEIHRNYYLNIPSGPAIIFLVAISYIVILLCKKFVFRKKGFEVNV